MNLAIALISTLVSVGAAYATTRYQTRRLKAEFATQFMAEAAVKQLLDHRTWELRTFVQIQRKVGGFGDDELRQILVRAGAVRFYSRETNEELWGLLARNRDALG